MNKCEIYTDGSCEVSNRVGGWAYNIYLSNGHALGELYEGFDGECDVTNIEMEVMAVLKGIEKAISLKREECEIIVFTDSNWVINCMTNPIWKCIKHVKILNKIKKYSKRFNIKFKWVKAHALNKRNIRVDKLANKAMRAEMKKIM